MDFQETANCGIVYSRSRVRGSYSSIVSSGLDEENVKKSMPRAGNNDGYFL